MTEGGRLEDGGGLPEPWKEIAVAYGLFIVRGGDIESRRQHDVTAWIKEEKYQVAGIERSCSLTEWGRQVHVAAIRKLGPSRC